MGKITDGIKKVHAAMDIQENKEDLGKLLRNYAIEAIASGPNTTPWRTYMSMFAENEEQLELLSLPKETDDKYLRHARAYLVANSVCAVHTNTRTGNGIFQTQSETALDENVSAIVDEKLKKKWRPENFAKFVK